MTDCRRIAKSRIKDWIVSTVRLPDSDEYETLVYHERAVGDDIHSQRYDTQEAAHRGHDKIVAFITRLMEGC